MINKAKQFITRDIWRIPLKETSPHRSFLIRQARIILLAIRGFTEDLVQLRASALTFYSMLSIVPVVAMFFGIAKGFGFDRKLEEQLRVQLAGQEEVLTWVIAFANNFLEKAQGGVVAGVGIGVLFWSVMKVLGNIEHSLNDIWQIRKPRSLVRKFSDYFSMMLVAPILILLSSSVTVYITYLVESYSTQHHIFSFLGSMVMFFIKLSPYVIIWLLFTLVYIVMPNTKVKFSSGLIAGIIAGTLFQLTQWGYIHFQVGVSKYNAIYGSFAALPLFLMWLQVSWLILLFGAEISFANQNVDNYEFESESLQISNYYKRIIALLVAHHLVKNFERGDPPLTAREISHQLDIPIRLLHQILFELTEVRVLVETVMSSPKDKGYQPARDIHTLSLSGVQIALERRGVDNIGITRSATLKKIAEAQEEFAKAIERSPNNKLLKDI